MADGTRFLPDDRAARARVLQWMFFEQYSHEPNIAVARSWRHHPEDTEERRVMLEIKMAGGRAALAVMDAHLADNDYFVGRAYSIADIALYAYTHVAGEGGFDLGAFGAVRGWLDRVAGEPGYIPITRG